MPAVACQAKQCREELAKYKKTSAKYASVNRRPTGLRLRLMQLKGQYIYKKAYVGKIARGVKRRIGSLRR